MGDNGYWTSGEGAAKTRRRHIRSDQSIYQRALAGAGAAKHDGDCRPILSLAQMKPQRRGIGAPALDSCHGSWR